MITTNLTFALDKSEDGQLSYKLDPYVCFLYFCTFRHPCSVFPCPLTSA